ncbi:MAG: DUF3108 domain-containing protein [Candidatus Omnitrophota bacterium]
MKLTGKQKILLLLVSAAAIVLPALFWANFSNLTGAKTAIGAAPVVPDDPIRQYVGEKIKYQVKLGIFPVGEAEFKHESITELFGTAVHLVSFRTSLARFKDNEIIYCLPGNLLPVRVERTIEFWPKKEKIVEEYDQTGFSLKITRQEGDRSAEQIIKRDTVIHNAILLPYYVRTVRDLKEGWRMDVQLPTQRFVVSLASLEDVKVPAGTFRAYHFISDPQKFEIWISADEKRIPLKLKGTSAAGYTLLLTDYSL